MFPQLFVRNHPETNANHAVTRSTVGQRIRLKWMGVFSPTQGVPPMLSFFLRFAVYLSIRRRIMNAGKKEMVPVTRDYTVNLHKACHKV